MISFSTNVCAADDVRIRHTLPSWLRAFPEVGEFVVVVDERPPTGRIAQLHRGHGNLKALYAELQSIAGRDGRVKIVPLRTSDGEDVLAKWFGPGSPGRYPFVSAPRPVRCQAGTPILAFIHAVEVAAGPTVLRADCDMLFSNRGWLTKAQKMLDRGAVDILEPRRLGVAGDTFEFSTRAFVLNRERFAARLPLVAGILDPLRTVHRLLNGRPPWLALEQMIEKERRRGRLTIGMLPAELGSSLHVATHQQASLPWFGEVPPRVERGDFPGAQVAYGPNFSPDAWMSAAGA